LRGFWVAGGQISPSPIDFHRRPYNTLALPCERVIRELQRFIVSAFGLSEFRIASISREIGRSLKLAVPSFYNEGRYASKTSQDCSTSGVVS